LNRFFASVKRFVRLTILAQLSIVAFLLMMRFGSDIPLGRVAILIATVIALVYIAPAKRSKDTPARNLDRDSSGKERTLALLAELTFTPEHADEIIFDILDGFRELQHEKGNWAAFTWLLKQLVLSYLFSRSYIFRRRLKSIFLLTERLLPSVKASDKWDGLRDLIQKLKDLLGFK